ncbi:MAG: hypothetical protein GF409_07720 [Candidatus Omnitrophica bacterium]|nr:hypothetical protein [Candidatus Omnitrophota bacterium]
MSWKNNTSGVSDYYEAPVVKKRMAQYLGGETLEDATAIYVTRCDSWTKLKTIKKPSELDFFLGGQSDVGRSLWDKKYLIAHLDIEYVNFDFPAEPYLDQERSFSLQVPLVDTIKKILAQYGIAPFHLVTGRGHHFTWLLRQDSEAFKKLKDCGHLSRYLAKFYRMGHGPEGESITRDLAKAYSGLGLVLESLVWRVLVSGSLGTEIPVKPFCSPEKKCERGWEALIVDISEYGDPLHTRMIRLPFSLYLKPWEEDVLSEGGIGPKTGLSCAIPGDGLDTSLFAEVTHNPERILDLAAGSDAHIPDTSVEMEKLIMDYERSRVKYYHDWFFSREQCRPSEWPRTYDLFSLSALPPCARKILTEPNDLLLKPVCIDYLVKILLSLGWHPRHIAGIMRSKYERDHAWGDLWYHYDAGLRADFYCRVITSGIFLGTDKLDTFGCELPRKFCYCEKDCPGLEKYRLSLLKRRDDGKLASSPFNRLLL